MSADFIASAHGSICLLTPVSEAAQEWAHEHLPDDALRFGHAYVIEPRYLEPILDAISEYVLVTS